MSFEMPSSAASPAGRRVTTIPRRRSRALLPTLLTLVGLLLLFGVFTTYYTDWLWFRSVNYTGVYRVELLTKTLLFLVFGALLGGAVVANFVLAYRFRPAYSPLSPEQQNLDRYRTAIEPARRFLVIGAGALLALIGGSSAAGQWRTFLLWRNGTPVNQRDAEFGRDVSFYMFSLPWLRFALSFLFTTLILSLIAAAVTHYLYGGLRLQGMGERTTPATRVHLSALLGLFVLAKAAAYLLDRYSLVVKDDAIGNRPFTGLTYTDDKAVLQAKVVLAAIAVICALLFFANFVWRTWLLPGIGIVLLMGAALLVGSVLPAAVQYFQVRPAEPTRERDYIGRNIEATRSAYDIADAQVEEYNATTQVNPRVLTAGQDQTIPGTRLLDPTIVPPAFRQLQQIRQFYGFSDALDVDRYTINGQVTDVVVAVREIDPRNQPQRNWFNDTLVYTHGFGFVAAQGNTREQDGKPTFVESNIPPTGQLGVFEPRIYFGETSPFYSIVGGPPGGRQLEVDFPDDTNPSGQRNNTYAGNGGVPVGSLVNRLLYAVKFQEEKILLSGDINSASKVLYVRSPRERVAKVAPWLTLDGDPYPAVVDGRIQWIVDGYTTSSSYPYSQRTGLGDATDDTLAARTTAVANQAADARVNYIRNAVKATVDAYDGTVTLYAWDEDDPVLQTWQKAFPGSVKAKAEIPPSLLQHMRYPQDLFKVQRKLLASYHVTDPGAFYAGQAFWQVPKDPTNQSNDQPPFYLTVQMPGQQPRFSLTTTYVPRDRPNLAAFAAVEAEPGPGYGRIRVLQVPTNNTAIAGPAQAFAQFAANPEVATQINLLSRGGSEVRLGNLLTLPVGGGFLYVEPVYVQAQGTNPYPLLQRVRVSYGDRIGFAETLPQALDDLVRDAPLAPAPDAAAPGSPAPPSASPSPGGTPRPPATGPRDEAALSKALADADRALREADTALRKGDLNGYAEAQRRLSDAVNRAVEAQGRGGSRAQPPPASPSATGPPPARA